jgi:hypothetical protein
VTAGPPEAILVWHRGAVSVGPEPTSGSDVEEPALRQAGWEFIQASRFAEAVDVLGPYVASAPYDAIGLRRLAVALLGVNEPEEALLLIQRSLALDPSAPRTHRALAYALAMLGRPQESLAAMRLACDPAHADAGDDAFLAQLLAHTPGGMSEAWHRARRAATLEPADSHIRQMNAGLRRAWLRRCRATAFVNLAVAVAVLIGYGLVGPAPPADHALMAGLATLLVVLPVGVSLGAIERFGSRRPARPVPLPAAWVRPTVDAASFAVGPLLTAAVAWWSGAPAVTIAILSLLVAGLGAGAIALTRRWGRRAKAVPLAAPPTSDGHIHEA